jgi:hypothetical protein
VVLVVPAVPVGTPPFLTITTTPAIAVELVVVIVTVNDPVDPAVA